MTVYFLLTKLKVHFTYVLKLYIDRVLRYVFINFVPRSKNDDYVFRFGLIINFSFQKVLKLKQNSEKGC